MTFSGDMSDLSEPNLPVKKPCSFCGKEIVAYSQGVLAMKMATHKQLHKAAQKNAPEVFAAGGAVGKFQFIEKPWPPQFPSTPESELGLAEFTTSIELKDINKDVLDMVTGAFAAQPPKGNKLDGKAKQAALEALATLVHQEAQAHDESMTTFVAMALAKHLVDQFTENKPGTAGSKLRDLAPAEILPSPKPVASELFTYTKSLSSYAHTALHGSLQEAALIKKEEQWLLQKVLCELVASGKTIVSVPLFEMKKGAHFSDPQTLILKVWVVPLANVSPDAGSWKSNFY